MATWRSCAHFWPRRDRRGSWLRLILLDPHSDIGVQEWHLIVLLLGVMLAVVILIIALMPLFLSHSHHATTTQPTHALEGPPSTRIEAAEWAAPGVIAVFDVPIWRTTHTLTVVRQASGTDLLQGRQFRPRTRATASGHFLR